MNPLYLVLIVLLVALIVGAFPAYRYNQEWGYGPSGVFGLLLVVLIILLVLRVI